MAMEPLRPCLTAGDEVLFLGDSYSTYGIAHRPIADHVEEQARPAGSLGAAENYRSVAVPGTTLAAGAAQIPTQWDRAKADTPIHLVVMSAGGNDVLINNQQCRAEGSESRSDCQMVVMNSLNKGREMWADMEASGVTDVIWFWYPHIPGGALTGGQSAISISDYTYPMLVDAAEAASTDTFHVQMIPTVDIFAGHPEYFASDGLHANDRGTEEIAKAIWQVMSDNCIAQPESSGCCAP